MDITPQAVKKLRDKTGAGMMDAKQALEEAEGSEDKAVEILRKQGQAKAAKKADRTVKAGLIGSYVHMGRVGVLVEAHCETDFMAKTDEFAEFVNNLAMHIAASAPEYLDAEDVPQAVIDQEKQVYKAEIEDKPAETQDQIIAGKLDKFYSEVCLYQQPYIKDTEQTVGDYIKQTIGKLGENIVIARFKRFELGVADE